MVGQSCRKVEELIAWRLIWAIISGTGLRPALVIRRNE